MEDLEKNCLSVAVRQKTHQRKEQFGTRMNRVGKLATHYMVEHVIFGFGRSWPGEW